MGKVYHILLIEDDESDADLIKLELNKLDLEIQLDVITEKQELKSHLQNDLPDLIISDYNLPALTGTDALKIVRKKSPHLPFILVSGFIGEEKAVDAMLEGASDYAMKQNLDRLGPAILREIANYEEHKKQTEELKKTQDRYESLVQSVNGIVWEADAKSFEFSYVSPQVKQLLGYTPEEWLQTPNFWQEHIHPEDRGDAVNFCHHKTQQGENHSFEYRMIDAEDEIIWLRDYVTVIMKDGAPHRLRGFIVDITQQKEAERQRDKAYEIADIGHWELDLIHDELYWSDTVKKLHEVDEDFDPVLETALDFYKEGVHRQKVTSVVERAIETGEPFDLEAKIVTPQKNELWVRVVGEAEFRNNKCTRIYGSTQNINQRKEIEQKLRDVVEHSTNMFYRHNTNHELSYVSPQAQRFLGCSPQEAMQKWTEFVTNHPVNEKGLTHTQKAIDTGQTQPAFPLQLQKKNGDTIWVRVNEAPITENGETIAIVGSLTDITEQKKYEEELEDTNNKLKTAQEIAKLGYWQLDIENDQVYWSDQTYRIWEFDPQKEITLDLILERMHADDREHFLKQNEKALNDHQPMDLEHRIVLPDGTIKWVHLIGNIKSKNGAAPTLEGTVQDITEKKKLEQLLNQTNRLARVGSWEVDLSDPENPEVFWSDMTKEILEVDASYTPTLKDAFEFYTEESQKEVQEAVEKAIEEGIPFDLEALVKTAKGNKRWVRSIGQAEFVDGQCIRIYGSYQDINERKKSELELARRNTFIETIIDNLPIGIAVNRIDDDKTILMNSKFSAIYGWPKEILRDVDTFFQKIYPDKEHREQQKKQMLADVQSGDPNRMQWTGVTISTQDGEERIVDAKNIPLFDQNQMISTVIDVTAEKKAERERIRILESISDAFYAVDSNWNLTYFNKEAENLLEKKAENIIGQNLWEVFSPAKETELHDVYQRVFKTGESEKSFEYFYPPLKSWFEISVYAGEKGLSVFFRNINDRKESEKKLKQLNRELEERAEELEKANAELEQFAYVASHDLQEPLRMVTSFLKRLETKYSTQLDDKAQQYINFAVDGAQRMRRIILDLLNYSRMNQHEFERERIDVNTLLQEVKKTEQRIITNRNAEIIYGDLPQIEAARTPLLQVFQNLINNGIKYQNPNAEPKITIDAEENETHWQFSVSDNGIGIKEDFQENIFTIFQRLHTQDEYEGTGIGLSIAQKIVGKHGGQIWVESQEGAGSTFYFTIKKTGDQQ